jgi:iron complex outermembrane recepter protein
MHKSDRETLKARLIQGTSLLLAGFALCTAPAAYAQDQANSDNEIVVTGSRLATRGFDAPTPVAVISAEDIKLSGTSNVEKLLGSSPQFIAATNGGDTANTVPGGNAFVNLRGFGPQRNLVLVNGRRFAIQGPDQTTDLNTIPSALVARTEIVTGGSSAVYGSDAITGVVNFIMREDFEGVEASFQHSWDSPTTTPTDDLNITFGGNFDGGRGNAVISVNYFNRGAITRGDRGGWTFDSLSDGCVTAASWSSTHAGTPLAVPSGQTCRTAGGIPGLVAGGSGDIPNSRWSGLPLFGSSSSNAGLDAAYTAAGIADMGAFGITFDDSGATARAALDPQDRYNLGPENYLQVPQVRWMLNAFSHYDINDKMTGYLEFHFSDNTVDQQLAPSNFSSPLLLNINNPYLSPQMQEVLHQLDLRETGPTNVTVGPVTRVNNPDDGFAAVNIGRRFVGVGDRFNSADRATWRTAVGLRGDLGDVSPGFLRELHYDMHYQYARTDETDLQNGSISRSRYQAALLEVGAAAPVCNVFGDNITADCATAIGINSTNVTNTEMQGAAAALTGVAFDLPAGPVDFSFGAEWRYSKSKYTPDTFLASGDVAGFNPSLPTAGSESVKEVFGEVRVPILAGVPMADNLSLNGAFRYSDYDLKGVGGVWTYSYGVDWRAIEDVTVRAQFQHAIRAPNIGELFGGRQTNFNAFADPCGALATDTSQAVRDVCVATGVPAANVFTGAVQTSIGQLIPNTNGGNPNLDAETSDTTTFGVVLRPRVLHGLTASIDYFDIKLDGAIAPLGGGLAGAFNTCYGTLKDPNSVFCQVIGRDPSTGAVTTPYEVSLTNANIGGLETSGVDYAANYSLNFDWGLFGNSSSVSLNTYWTWTNEFKSQPVQDLPTITDCVGSFGSTCGEPTPEWKGVSRITWDTGPLQLSLRYRYVGKVTVDSYLLPVRSGQSRDLADFTNPVVDAQNYFDISGSFDVGEKLELFGGVNNIVGDDPPVLGSSTIRANTWPATYDILGRFFFIGATVKLH